MRSIFLKGKFTDLSTADGVPYGHIAQLHSKDVLATTVMQNCMLSIKKNTCKFCAIGQSLAVCRTIGAKKPATACRSCPSSLLVGRCKTHGYDDGHSFKRRSRSTHFIRLCQSIRAAVDLPPQAQCEPPSDDLWHVRMKESGTDSLGMHLEVVNPILRKEIMPGKSEVSLDRYFESFPLRSKFSDGDRFRLTF